MIIKATTAQNNTGAEEKVKLKKPKHQSKRPIVDQLPTNAKYQNQKLGKKSLFGQRK